MKKFFILFAAVVMTALLAGCWDMGSGEKIGTITRLSKRGVFCKTWEGEIIRGGLNSGSGVMGQAFHFTIEDEILAKEVEKAMNSQQEVKISYHMEGVTWCRSDSGDDFLTKIVPLGDVSTPPVQSKEVTIAPAKPVSADLITQELLKQNQQMINNQQAMLEEMRKQREAAGRTPSQKE